MRPFTAHTEPESPAGDSQCCPAARSECGFTLVELIIVMVICAILMGGVLYAFTSVKSSGYKKETIVTARAFETAIDAFANDHNGRVPVLNSQEFAPATSSRGTQIPFSAGPKDQLTQRPYMRAPADGITTGRILFQRGGTALPTNSGIRGVIQYQLFASNQRHYRLAVILPVSGNWKKGTETCYVGNWLQGGKRC